MVQCVAVIDPGPAGSRNADTSGAAVAVRGAGHGAPTEQARGESEARARKRVAGLVDLLHADGAEGDVDANGSRRVLQLCVEAVRGAGLDVELREAGADGYARNEGGQ